MKKVLLVGAFLLGVSAVSFAQGRGMRSPEESTAALKTSLSLNDAQAAKVKVIYEAQGKTRDSLMTAMQGGGDRQSMMASFTKMTDATNAKIKAVLTADQQATFQKQVDEQAAQRRQRMGN